MYTVSRRGEGFQSITVGLNHPWSQVLLKPKARGSKAVGSQSVRPNLVLCFNLVLSSLELPAHAFRALKSCRHAGEGLPCCPVTSSGTSGAANGRAGEQYQVKARYQVRANALLYRFFRTEKSSRVNPRLTRGEPYISGYMCGIDWSQQKG